MFSVSERITSPIMRSTDVMMVDEHRVAPIHRQMLPEIEGFVDIRPDNRRMGFIFEGLLVPYMDAQGFARNRFLLIDRSAPEWFLSLCHEIADRNQVLEDYGLLKGSQRYERMQVRLKLVSRPQGKAGSLAFFVPCAESLEAAHEEWAKKKSQLLSMPQTLAECETEEEEAYFLSEYVAEKLKLRIIRQNQQDIMRDCVIAVNSTGILVRISGAQALVSDPELMDAVLDFRVPLDKAVEQIRHQRILDRRGL